MKPSISVAYSMKKKKCASGGTVESGDKTMNYAEGGRVGDNKHREDHEKGVHRAALGKHSPGMSSSGFLIDKAPHSLAKKHAEVISKGMHENKLQELKEMPRPKLPMADGGEVNPMMEVTCPHCTKSFSHGGQVANSDLPVADFSPNEFDDLHLRDDLESHYTGKNSGDELGGPSKDDLVARAMLKRKAKR